MANKRHVKRIFQIATDDSGNPSINTGVWIDVMRHDEIDVLLNGVEEGIVNQEIDYILLWNDNPFNHRAGGADDSNADANYENANAARTMTQIEVKNPDSPDDQSQSVFLWIIQKTQLDGYGQPDGTSVPTRTLVYNNHLADQQDGNAIRKATVISVANNDLNGNLMDDGNGKAIIVDWETYKTWLSAGQNDASGSNLNVEVADKYTMNLQSDTNTGNAYQEVEFVLYNGDIEGDRNNPPLFPSGDNSLVIRTDPFQVIVNASGGLAVIFGPKDQDAPDQKKQQAGLTKQLMESPV